MEALPFSDDILAEILIRLPTLADFGRACASCPAFCRVITAPSFLRRLRALHPQTLLGFHTLDGGFHPAEAPHPSAPAARALAAAADFSLSFLPSPDRWRHRDFRDGLTLVSAVPVPNEGFALVKNLAVCDILHRRYLLLPVVAEDMEGLVEQEGFVHYETFLDPAGDDEGDSSFRVFCLALGKTKLVLFVFSSSSGRWDAVAFDGWKDLIDAGSSSQTRFRPGLTQRYYTHGCIYWVIRSRNKLLMLDTHLMKFSCIDVPPAPLFQQRAIVEAGEGRLGMFVLRFHSGNDTYDLCYTVLPDDGQCTIHLQPQVTIPLPLNHCSISGAVGGFLLISGILRDQDGLHCNYFSLNLKTFQLERFCGAKNIIYDAQLFAGFPPSLCPPTL